MLFIYNTKKKGKTNDNKKTVVLYDTKKIQFTIFYTLAAEFTKRFYIKTLFFFLSCFFFYSQYMLTIVWATCTVTNRRPDYSGLLRESRRRHCHCGIISIGIQIKACSVPAHIWLNHCHFVFILHLANCSDDSHFTKSCRLCS